VTLAIFENIEEFKNWEYTEEWLDKLFGKIYGKTDKIFNILNVMDASFSVRFYIYYNGPNLIATQRHINRFIELINSGQFESINDSQKMLNFISRFEALPNRNLVDDIEKDMDILYAYNYKKLPNDLVEIIEKIDMMRKYLREIYNNIVNYLNKIVPKKIQEDREKRIQEIREQAINIPRKWEQIEKENTKVKEGIVYVLTNDLMPGLVKIGFTAGNPEIRASRLSEQHNLPAKFNVAGYVRTKDPYIVEQKVHNEISSFRVSGEFFKISENDAIEIVKKYSIS
jgi:hypothetical protein